MIPISKKDNILDSAEELIQRRGFNGFSYADISDVVGIRKASIHHYFPSKTSLTVAVIKRYRETFKELLAKISDKQKTWESKIIHYAKLYENVLRHDKLCLCGMLAADIETLPSILKKEVSNFFTDNVSWLSETLAEANRIKSKSRLDSIAWQVIATLQGAVLMARMIKTSDVFSSSVRELILQLKSMK